MARSDTTRTQTKHQMKEFIEALGSEEACGNILIACIKTGCSRGYMYKLKSKYKKFSDEWDLAVEIGKSTLEDQAKYALRKAVLAGKIWAIQYALVTYHPEKWGNIPESKRYIQHGRKRLRAAI